MTIQISPAKPWVNGQMLTDGDGFQYVATGANSAKPFCAPMVVRGPAGDKGSVGIPGANGSAGVNGPDGPDGPDGADGADGADGTDGTDGVDANCLNCFGPTGDKGPAGDKGPTGDPGEPGSGFPGDRGPDGADGTDGADGEDVFISCESVAVPSRGILFTTGTGSDITGMCHVDFEQCCTVDQITKCGKVSQPVVNVSNPSVLPIQNNSTSSYSGSWALGSGVSLDITSPPTTSTFTENATPSCVFPVIPVNVTGSYDIAVSGLDALACEGCEACLVLDIKIGSLNSPVDVNFTNGFTVLSTEDATVAGSTIDWDGNGESGVADLQTTLTSDGLVLTTEHNNASFTGDANGNGDVQRICILNAEIKIPVTITCLDNEEQTFVSAVDCNGNSYTEAQVE